MFDSNGVVCLFSTQYCVHYYGCCIDESKRVLESQRMNGTNAVSVFQ